MDFWQTYKQESLYSPWLVGPETDLTEEVEPGNEKVFVVPPGSTPAHYSMVSKMILALNYNPGDVSVIEREASYLQSIAGWENPKKILFFGAEYAGGFGELVHWQGHQVIKTHSLKKLEHDMESKKQTWSHLKKYGSVS